MTRPELQTEQTQQGTQTLIHGVKPITNKDRLALLAGAPLAPRRAQKPCNIGLFDEDARNQLDMFIHGAANGSGKEQKDSG